MPNASMQFCTSNDNLRQIRSVKRGLEIGLATSPREVCPPGIPLASMNQVRDDMPVFRERTLALAARSMSPEDPLQ
jgi:hypothetical protein